MKKIILQLVLIGLVSCSKASIDPSENKSEDLQQDYVIVEAQPFQIKMTEAIAIRLEDLKEVTYEGDETIFLSSEEMIIQEDFFSNIEEQPYFSNSDTIYLNNENVVRAWSIKGPE
ncbi:hypothetical protein [Salegentibacter mishustinae]|uniref:Uncharacterized protein n=1 Tax=Salegentibacter mishustinae TaxID=270918 RepID=A0A0Q9ZBW0_9FLAO|nr:hypothetical protein [Salegentibacter mishustinae]KRG30541.1 hypothetical protein APR42_01350 [Salegentibacter mishustinae]PNW23432.1 hypothetical protein APB85_01345 [Salegentibacter mishustinae]PZX66499.1 hypothetical protein LY54_00896 [Salegentibacter mishustinae]GGW82888.1 hypothetical protein GCM10008086_08610 [Salegentibacter mishustinae]